MKQILNIGFLVILLASPLHAQQSENDMEEGFSLLQDGARLLLQGLMQELGPALLEFEGKLVELKLYHAPVVLPNGDIIIRRRVPIESEKDGETDI